LGCVWFGGIARSLWWLVHHATVALFSKALILEMLDIHGV
jgi:hypothetical protein